jgi:transposase-like protein
MTARKKHKTRLLAVEAVAGHGDLMKALMKEALQEVLEGETSEFLGAAPGQRTESRTGYCSLISRIGKLVMRVSRERNGEFLTVLFERYARSDKALVAVLAEMDVQGVSTRKVRGHYGGVVRSQLLGQHDYYQGS